jgi:hypothetical protein
MSPLLQSGRTLGAGARLARWGGTLGSWLTIAQATVYVGNEVAGYTNAVSAVHHDGADMYTAMGKAGPIMQLQFWGSEYVRLSMVKAYLQHVGPLPERVVFPFGPPPPSNQSSSLP